MHCDSCILKNIRALHPKSIYLMFSIWSKTTPITVGVGGSGANPHTLKMWTFFLMPLTLRMPIFNKKYNWARAEVCIKQEFSLFTIRSWNFGLRNSSVRLWWDFCWKLAYIMPKAWESAPAPPSTVCNSDSFTPYRGRQVKTFWTKCMYFISNIFTFV